MKKIKQLQTEKSMEHIRYSSMSRDNYSNMMFNKEALGHDLQLQNLRPYSQLNDMKKHLHSGVYDSAAGVQRENYGLRNVSPLHGKHMIGSSSTVAGG